MRRALHIAVGLIALMASADGAGAQDGSLEYPIKAAFLYRFGSYVEWPRGSFPAGRAPLHLCVVGRDPFGNTLDEVVRGQTIDGRPIMVRRLASVAPSSGCHIAFLGGSAEQPAATAARALAGSPVLTVADGPLAGERPAVEFAMRANRVRFKIDLRSARSSGLGISSKLLNLALEVER